jgi:hypothetical protein
MGDTLASVSAAALGNMGFAAAFFAAECLPDSLCHTERKIVIPVTPLGMPPQDGFKVSSLWASSVLVKARPMPWARCRTRLLKSFENS